MRTYFKSPTRGFAIGLLAAAVMAAAGCNNADDSTTLPANADIDSAQVDPSASGRPTTIPSAPSRKPSRMTSPITSADAAPSAILMPISFVRRFVRQATTP